MWLPLVASTCYYRCYRRRTGERNQAATRFPSGSFSQNVGSLHTIYLLSAPLPASGPNLINQPLGYMRRRQHQRLDVATIIGLDFPRLLLLASNDFNFFTVTLASRRTPATVTTVLYSNTCSVNAGSFGHLQNFDDQRWSAKWHRHHQREGRRGAKSLPVAVRRQLLLLQRQYFENINQTRARRGEVVAVPDERTYTYTYWYQWCWWW